MSNDYVAGIVATYRRHGIIVDTNLMLLAIIGRYDVGKIRKFRATSKYSLVFYKATVDIISEFSLIHTTPQLLTEIDNLSRQVEKTEWGPISDVLRSSAQSLTEAPVQSLAMLMSPLHAKFGITDCSIFHLSDSRALVLTDDLPLTVELERRGRAVINLSRLLQ